MGINSTNRIINPHRQVMIAVQASINRKEYNKKHNPFTKVLDGTVKCTQCGRGMSRSFGKKQIENKRKHAPICIPCCVGEPRKPLSEVEDLTAGWKKETKLKVGKLQKWRKMKY